MMTLVTLTFFSDKVKFCNLAFSIGKSEIVNFSETIAASDLKVGRCRQLIEILHMCEDLVPILHMCEVLVPILLMYEELVPILLMCEELVQILHM